MKYLLHVVFIFIFVSSCVTSEGKQKKDRPETKLKLGIPLVKLKPLKGDSNVRARSLLGPGDYIREIKVDGRSRFYEVHVPFGYRDDKPAPVIMAFHGGGGQPTAMRWWSRLDAASERGGFIVVYAAGTGYMRKKFGLTFNAGRCCGYALKNRVNDVAYTEAVLDDLDKFFRIDLNRIFVTGFSNGSQMAYYLACKLSDRFAAVAGVAAPMAVPECLPSRPMSVIHFQGKKDRAVPFGGGVGEKGVENTGFSHISAEEHIRLWLKNNKCPKEPTRQWRRGKVQFYRYGPCQDDTEVMFCIIEDGGHSIPGGDLLTQKGEKAMGYVNQDISAADVMWEFFQKHPRKR
jgi:polyhydroxybutyrate depolymerase